MLNRAYHLVKTAFFGGLLLSAPTYANEGVITKPFGNIQNTTGSICPNIGLVYHENFSNSFLIGHLDQFEYYQENSYLNPATIVINTLHEFDKIASEEDLLSNQLEELFDEDSFKVVVAEELSDGQAGQFSNAHNQLSIINPANSDRVLSYVRHEIQHAKMGLFHRKNNKQSTTPYDTMEQKDHLLNAIKKGDQRVKELGKRLDVLEEKLKNKTITAEETTEYESTIALFNQYQPRFFGEPIDSNGKIASNKLIRKIINTPYGKIALTSHALNTDSNQAKTHAFIKDMNERSGYVKQLYFRPYISQNENEQIQTKENDAAIFEAPYSILKVFYPEVLNYHAEFAKIKKEEATKQICRSY